MTDIFFSYRSVDRERVRPIRDAFAKQGFEVFWDQEVPSGVDWDTWIRQHLAKSKCAVVFWSLASVESDNVRHEATVAKRQGKLVAVLLEPLAPDQFPMGLYSQQAINLTGWKDSFDNVEWRKLISDIEAKLTPPWIQQKVYELEAELVAERARREGAENKDRILQAQIGKEVLAQDDLRRERDKAADEIVALRTTIDTLTRERACIEAKSTDLSKQLELLTAEAQELALSNSAHSEKVAKHTPLSSIGSPAVYISSVLAALAVGFGFRMLVGTEASIRTVPLQDSIFGTTRPQSSAVPAAEPELAMPPTQSSLESPSGLFLIRKNTEALGNFDFGTFVSSIADCEQRCQKMNGCTVFTFGKNDRACLLYDRAELRTSPNFDTGVRK